MEHRDPGFKPLAGITCIATINWEQFLAYEVLGFKPLAGITCIARLNEPITQ